MNPQELRIGNIVFDKEQGKPDVITAIEKYRVGLENSRFPYTPGDIIEAVELTEEWLLRFGFTKHRDVPIQSTYFENKYCWIYLLPGKNQGFEFEWITSAGRFNLFRSFHYVHQLQNLFFDLTGEELVLDAEKETA